MGILLGSLVLEKETMLRVKPVLNDHIFPTNGFTADLLFSVPLFSFHKRQWCSLICDRSCQTEYFQSSPAPGPAKKIKDKPAKTQCFKTLHKANKEA